MIGRLIHGKFEVLDEIGRGGMGVVYRARQLTLDRIVALKMLSANLVEDEEFCERFRQEAKIIARLTHPNIIQVYDIYDVEDEENGGFCIVMEYLDGRPLSDLLREQGKLGVERAIAIADQVAAGLGYAHRQGIVHRDIKPDNIMMLEDDTVKIMDFGIARLRDSSIHTRTGVTMGTPQFMSPEQAAGKTVDARSDLYSLAVVLYTMLTGALPFTGDSPITIALKHIQEPPPRPSKADPTIPPALDSIILKGMAKNPADRFQTAEEFRRALSDFLSTKTAVPAAAEPQGEETYVSTPVLVPGVVEETADDPQNRPADPMAPRATGEAVSVAETGSPARLRHLFSWGWLVAAVPGVLALILAVFIAYRLTQSERITRDFLAKASLTEVMSRLSAFQRSHPDEVHRSVNANEDVLFERLAKAIKEREAAGKPYEAWGVRRWARRTILPNLAEGSRKRWEELLGSPIPEGRRGTRRRWIFERFPSGENGRMDSVLKSLKEPVEADPAKAREKFAAARKAEKDLEKETDPPKRLRLFAQCLNDYAESVRYDPENPRYKIALARFLLAAAAEMPPSQRRLILLRTAQSLLNDAKGKISAPRDQKMLDQTVAEIEKLLQEKPRGPFINPDRKRRLPALPQRFAEPKTLPPRPGMRGRPPMMRPPEKPPKLQE